ncbi:MAG: hypothetical protein KAQ98_02235 [Bacteriovoracaceae bacterium]|nr:hypothetical protein [Bacteriovoracaceae bacterium]
MRTALALIVVFFLFNGCAFVNRTFVDEMEMDTDGIWVASRDFPIVAGDSGKTYRSDDDILERTPASLRESDSRRHRVSIVRELARKEEKLKGREHRTYQTYRDYFENDSERIYYLDLSPAERVSYIKANWPETPIGDISAINNDYGRSDGLKYLSKGGYGNKDIYLGMRKDDVVGSWGRPARVDVAGNPKYQNERWSFHRDGRVRYVYFEKGVVQGWAID